MARRVDFSVGSQGASGTRRGGEIQPALETLIFAEGL